MITTSTIAIYTRLTPRWLAIVGYIIGGRVPDWKLLFRLEPARVSVVGFSGQPIHSMGQQSRTNVDWRLTAIARLGPVRDRCVHDTSSRPVTKAASSFTALAPHRYGRLSSAPAKLAALGCIDAPEPYARCRGFLAYRRRNAGLVHKIIGACSRHGRQDHRHRLGMAPVRH